MKRMRFLWVAGAVLLASTALAAGPSRLDDRPRPTRDYHDLYMAGRHEEALAIVRTRLDACREERKGPAHCYHLLDSASDVAARAGDREASTAYALELLDGVVKAPASVTPGTSTDLGALGKRLEGFGKHAAAEPFFRRALSLWRTAHPVETLDPVTDYFEISFYGPSLARNLGAQGKYAEAEPIIREMVETARRLWGEDSVELADQYADLGDSLGRQGRHAEGEALLRKALATKIAKLKDTDHSVARTYRYLAANLNRQGRYADAEALYRKALVLDRAFFGERQQSTAVTYNDLAYTLGQLGRHVEAEALYRQALEIYQTTLGDNHPLTATAYSNLATNLGDQWRDAEAEPLARKALDLTRTTLGEDNAETAIRYNNLAATLSAQKRYPEATELNRRALEIRLATLGDRDPLTASSYANIGFALFEQGEYAQAAPLFQKALQIDRAALGDSHPDVARDYARIGNTLLAQGRANEAIPILRKALAIGRKALGDAHPDVAVHYRHLARALSLGGRTRESVELAGRSLAIARARRAMRFGGEAAGASADAGRRALAAAAGLDASRSDPMRKSYQTYLDAAWVRVEAAPRAAAALRAGGFEAAQDLEQSAAGQAMAQTAAREAAGTGPLADLVRRQQDQTGRARALDAELIAALGGRDAGRVTTLRAQLEALGIELAASDAQLRRDFPAYASLVAPNALPVAAVQSRLEEDEGLLLIVPGGDHVYSFAVSRRAVAWQRLTDGAARTAERVARLRCQIDPDTCASPMVDAPLSVFEEQGYRGFDRTAAFGLYDDLIAPVESALAGTKRLYVTISGPLSALPIGTLLTRAPDEKGDSADPLILQGNPWLADRYALTTLPSVSALRTLRLSADGASKEGAPFIGYGAPVLGSAKPASARGARSAQPRVFRGVDAAGFAMADPATLNTLGALPGTETELVAMARIFGASPGAVRLGAGATEAAVRADATLPRADVIAFATHGLLPREVNGFDEPGLVFTPPAIASSDDDGVLSASEVAGLRLSADWLILSACNTASADGTPDADSLSSLARSFLYAGAGALLASHWRVDDEATAALTVEALQLRRAAPGLGRAEALRRAAHAIRTGKREDGSAIAGWSEEWAHPAYWAPFSVISDRDR